MTLNKIPVNRFFENPRLLQEKYARLIQAIAVLENACTKLEGDCPFCDGTLGRPIKHANPSTHDANCQLDLLFRLLPI